MKISSCLFRYILFPFYAYHCITILSKCTILSITLVTLYFIKHIFSFIWKFLHLVINCILIVFLNLSLYLNFFPKRLYFYKLPCDILNFSYACYMKIFSIIWKVLYFVIQLYSKCVCMPIIASECFFSKNFQLYILSYRQFYHIYVRVKS